VPGDLGVQGEHSVPIEYEKEPGRFLLCARRMQDGTY
jgi:hypothetical protein